MKAQQIDLNDFSSTDPKCKYACAKQAILLSKEQSATLYSDFDFFITLLDSPNNILRWTAISVLGNLSRVDTKSKIDKILPKLFDYLRGGKLITANNTILALTEIAQNKPEYQDKIIEGLLKIKNYSYETSECKNIVLGKAILAFKELYPYINRNRKVLSFVRGEINNTRNATKTKAISLLKKLETAL